MHISQLKESKYLKKEDAVPPILVTIKKLTEANVALEGDPPDMKHCLHFQEHEKPMILNSTNAQLIAKALGSEETDDWSGKQIVLYNDPNVSYQGRLTGGLRVRAVKKNAKGQALPPPPEPVEEEDEIPF